MDVPALHAYAREIARELGPPWRYDLRASRDAHGKLWCCAALRTGLSEHGVSIRVDWRHKHRLMIRGELPDRDRDGNRHSTWNEWQDGKAPQISVAIERGARAAARAIVTRLLPAYEPAYAKVRARVDKANRELEEFHRVRAMLEPFGQLGRGREYSGASDGRVYLHAGGTARISTYSGRVRLELCVTAETAVQVLRLAEQDRPETEE